MKFQSLKVVGFVAAMLFASSALAGESRLGTYLARADVQSAPAQQCSDPRSDLIAAADKAGVKLNVEEIVTASSKDVTFVGTSIEGFEQVPATDLPKGVDAGFVYLDAPASGIPAGFYRLNAHANKEDVQKGTYPGTVGFIGADGKEVARVAATMETSSLTVPNPLPYARTRLETRIGTQNPERQDIIIIIIHCPNGTTIIIVIW
ncbi:hypothetical protein JY651_27785 [Pyxidicoccus parkwayensis]|uniref:Uncharacterized protein n=1 Tax=Pyxidicoccus parkwayensis TaxID=2813578 RepID=A0ABX7NNP3_9BACT|nr:hypothetical protein [Pyxidicoccus parkwaysis]QSQ19147.1 hypothetical protein JY651_27785 [Pyxidicoccus parkwaysis]